MSRSARESSARALGLRRRDLESVWNAIVSLYRTGLHPAISVCGRYRGSVVLERSIGHARGNQPDAPSNESKILATPDTRFNFYSGSKCVTHLLVHWLEARGELDTNAPVCEYLPEFARGGKSSITLLHLLTHRAGIPVSPVRTLDPAILHDKASMQEALYALKPTSKAGAYQAYHALTGGFILGEVMEAVTGPLPTRRGGSRADGIEGLHLRRPGPGRA